MRITSSLLLITFAIALELSAQRPLPVGVRPVTKTLTPNATGAPPVALAATGTPSTAALSWQWPAGATSFDVYRALAPSGNWEKLNRAPIAATTFNDATGFSYGQGYVYRVVSLYPNGVYGNADLRFQPPPPQNPAWVKAVQQGNDVVLSWAPVPGATRYVVAGMSEADGREVAAPASSVTYPNVAAGSHRWVVGARFDPGPMETPIALWPASALTVAPASGRYRVSITGMSVIHETRDDPMQYDGKRDEVFVAAQAIVLDRGSGAVVGKQVNRSHTYGDIHNIPNRLQAGTASSLGGIMSGDKLPAGDPSQPTGQPTPMTIPMLAFEGTLTDGQDEVLIFPVIFEADHGNGTVYSDWLTKVPQMRPTAEAAPDGMASNQFPILLATAGLSFSSGEGWNWQDEIRLDRPIGSVMGKITPTGAANINTYDFRPRVIRLQREELERRLATPFVANNGSKGIPLSIEFKEAINEYLGGDYILHLWIERVP